MTDPHHLEAPAAAACLAANLFLHVRTAAALVNYWMAEFTPPQAPLAPGEGRVSLRADEAAEADVVGANAGTWMYAVLRRLLRPPADLVLVGQGGMALTSDATQPQWSHVLNFLTPSEDFALAVPVAYLVRAQCLTAIVALLPLYQRPPAFWRRGQHGAMRGQHWFDHFEFVSTLAAHYHPSLFVALALQRFVRALVALVPPEQRLHEVSAQLRLALDALDARYLRDVRQEAERALLAQLRTALVAQLDRDVGECARLVDTFVASVRHVVTLEYREVAARVGPRAALSLDAAVGV